MDGSRFDAWIMALADPAPRRALLRALAAGAGLIGLARLDDAEGKKRRKKRRKQRPRPNPCAGRPDDAPCPGDGRCLNGRCNPRPTCHFTSCSGAPDPALCCRTECCAGSCVDGVDCAASSGAGAPCYDTGDCQPDLTCVGYRCR